MKSEVYRSSALLLLAAAFTVGLTCATVELPHPLDGVLQNRAARRPPDP